MTTPTSAPRVLNLGSGEVRIEGAVHIDRNADSKPDVVHDLNKYPWPFKDSSFDFIKCEHILEHLAEPELTLQEMHRLCAPGGVVEIITPHYSSPHSWNDLTHRYHFGLGAFDPYCFGNYGTKKLFNLQSRKLEFGTGVFGWPGWALCRLSIKLYEKYFAFWFPGRNMVFRLEAVKN